jgi:hypothetical protein
MLPRSHRASVVASSVVRALEGLYAASSLGSRLAIHWQLVTKRRQHRLVLKEAPPVFPGQRVELGQVLREHGERGARATIRQLLVVVVRARFIRMAEQQEPRLRVCVRRPCQLRQGCDELRLGQRTVERKSRCRDGRRRGQVHDDLHRLPRDAAHAALEEQWTRMNRDPNGHDASRLPFESHDARPSTPAHRTPQRRSLRQSVGGRGSESSAGDRRARARRLSRRHQSPGGDVRDQSPVRVTASGAWMRHRLPAGRCRIHTTSS